MGGADHRARIHQRARTKSGDLAGAEIEKGKAQNIFKAAIQIENIIGGAQAFGDQHIGPQQHIMAQKTGADTILADRVGDPPQIEQQFLGLRGFCGKKPIKPGLVLGLCLNRRCGEGMRHPQQAGGPEKSGARDGAGQSFVK